jgi:molecular chaperone GrpE
MMPRESEEKEKANNESAPPEELPAATISPEEALAEEKKRAEEYLANWQRAQADFINYKRRAEQERLEFNSYANANLVLSILPALDDLERAMAAIPEEYAKSDWVEGVRLVEKKFKTILEGQGLKPICALGMAFDPKLHEAIRHEKGKEGVVIAEYQKGYMLNDKLLRPSRVAVGKGEEEHPKKAHSEEKTKTTEKAGFDNTHPEEKKEQTEESE